MEKIIDLDFINAWIYAQKSVMETISKEEFDKLLKGEKKCQQKKLSKK